MKIGFIITGRMKSTRLPKKLILKLNNKEIIKWMIMRAQLKFPNDRIIIATSTNQQDDILETVGHEMGIKVFRGHEEDVVLRLYEAASVNNLDYFFNITADCPLFGYDYIDKNVNEIMEHQPDLITSLDLSHGFFVYGIKTVAFKKIIDIKKTEHTEVWGEYFYSNPKLFNVIKLSIPESEKRHGYRLTLDYPEDFDFFSEVFHYFGEHTYKKSSNEILKFLDENPHVVNINKDCHKLYQKRWEAQSAINLEKK